MWSSQRPESEIWRLSPVNNRFHYLRRQESDALEGVNIPRFKLRCLGEVSLVFAFPDFLSANPVACAANRFN